MYYSPKRHLNLCLSFLQSNVTTVQFLGCQSDQTTLRSFDEPLFDKEGVTIIQSLKVRMKNFKNFFLKNFTSLRFEFVKKNLRLKMTS